MLERRGRALDGVGGGWLNAGMSREQHQCLCQDNDSVLRTISYNDAAQPSVFIPYEIG